MDKIINKLPAHIWLGIAVLLFGLGLTLIMQTVTLPEWPGEKDTCPEGVICTDLPVPTPEPTILDA